jgi:type III secretion protein N (ATPase)
MVAQCLVHLAHPLRLQGNVIEAHLPGTRIGEVCEIQKSLLEPQILGLAQVIGFNKEHTLLSLLNDNQGLSRSNVLLPTGKPFRIEVHENIAGAIMDATGAIVDGWMMPSSQR